MYLSGLKPNLKKPELEGIGALKEVQVAVCGLCFIDLNNDTLKVLGTHFSYNEKLKEGKNFYKTVTNIQRVLNIWKMKKFTLTLLKCFILLNNSDIKTYFPIIYNNCPKTYFTGFSV